jgi:hypothetical protein
MAGNWTTKKFDWNGPQGNWRFSGSVVEQNEADYPSNTRCWTSIPCTDFIMAFRMRANCFARNPDYQTKFLFAAADQGEDFRIDFLYQSQACRVMGDPMGPSRLSLELNHDYDVVVKVKDNFIQRRS